MATLTRAECICCGLAFETTCPPRSRWISSHGTLTITRLGDDYAFSLRQRGIKPLGFVKNARTWPALRREA